jgi:hypothetical protein
MLGKAPQVFGRLQAVFTAASQPMLGHDQVEDDRVVTGQLGIATQVILNARRQARLEAILQIDMDQLDEGPAAQVPFGWQEGVEVRWRRGLPPGDLEALDDGGE